MFSGSYRFNRLCFQVENVGCRLYLPENNTSRHVMIAMSKNMKLVDRDGNILDKPFCYDIDDNKQWRRLTQRKYEFCLALRYLCNMLQCYW